MSLPQEAVPATADAPARLRDFGRYLGLVADQLEALKQRDLPRTRELAEERTRLEATLRDAPQEAPEEAEAGDEGERETAEPSDASLPADLAAELAQALHELHEFERQEEEQRTRWIALGDDALRSLQGARVRHPSGGQYVEFPAGDGRLDLRF